MYVWVNGFNRVYVKVCICLYLSENILSILSVNLNVFLGIFLRVYLSVCTCMCLRLCFGRARACSKPCLCTRSCECSCVCARACVCNVCICLSLRVSLCVLVFHTWFQCHISIHNSPVRLTHICKQNYTRVSD